MIVSLFLVAAIMVPAASPDARWQLIWSDEFDGGRIDPAKWSFVKDCWGGGNEERQCYTDSQRNAFVADGQLHIVARREKATGFALPEAQRAQSANPGARTTKPFTSARLVTSGRAAWRYGKIEIRARLPQGQGTWPAIWMLPQSSRYGPWAASGEIDILEAVNLGVRCHSCPGGKETRILGTLHFGGPWPDNRHAGREFFFPPVLEGFHTYAIEWSKGRIAWSVDGQVFAVQTAGDWHSSASRDPDAPFDEPFYLILNFAVGGRLAEERNLKGVDLKGYPKTMSIDWVRVWQCASDPETGRACVSNAP